MLKSSEKFSLIANAIISPEGSTEGEKPFCFEKLLWGALGINFYTFFIHFYHSANFKMIVAKVSLSIINNKPFKSPGNWR
jgi:hypothetical protein